VSGKPSNDNAFAGFDPLAGSGKEEGTTSALGAGLRGVVGGAAPGLLGVLPGAGAGAVIGETVFPFGGGLVGGIAGGIAGGFAGAEAVSAGQNWLLNKVPKFRDMLGQGEEQKRRDEEEHPVASFLGGIAPFAVTMSPFSMGKKLLPENATTWQRLAANPLTSRLFSGGIMGGMQIGQEAVHEENINWNRVAVATGFGLVWNKPTRFGEAISEYGARPARTLFGVPHPTPATERPPTPSEVSEQNVAGPGVTEATFMGSEQRNPTAEAAAQHTAGVEESLIGPVRSPELETTARQKEPDLFAEYDALQTRVNTERAWINSRNEPKPYQFLELEERRDALQKELDEHTAARNGYDRGPRARQLKAQIRQIEAEHTELRERGEAFAAGEAAETPEIAQSRKRLTEADAELRALAPRVQAAYRAAADYTGAQTVAPPPPEVAAPQQPTAETPAGVTQAGVPVGAATPQAAGSVSEQRAFIAKDIEGKMIAAGRPPEEAALAGQLVAARYVARAQRFGGALGTALDLYKSEGPKIIGGRVVTKAPEPTPGAPPSALPTNRAELAAYLAAGGDVSAAPKGGPVPAMREATSVGRAAAEREIEGQPPAAAHEIEKLEPQDQVTIKLNKPIEEDGRSYGPDLHGEYMTQAGMHFVSVPTEDGMGHHVLGPIEPENVASVTVTKSRAQISSERYEQARGAAVPGTLERTRGGYEGRLTDLAKAAANEKDTNRKGQIETQFDDVADEIALAQKKRKWLLAEAEYRAGGGTEEHPSRLEFAGGSANDALMKFEKPKATDFEPNQEARRASSKTLKEPGGPQDTLARLRKEGFGADYSVANPDGDPNRSVLLVTSPGGKEAGRITLTGTREGNAWKWEPKAQQKNITGEDGQRLKQIIADQSAPAKPAAEPIPAEAWKKTEQGTQLADLDGIRTDVWQDQFGRWHWVVNDDRPGIGHQIGGGSVESEAQAKAEAASGVQLARQRNPQAAEEPLPPITEVTKRAPRGPAAKDPEHYSLLEFLAKNGGLRPEPDTIAIFGGKNPFIPGFGKLFRATGKSTDRALEAAVEAGYIHDQGRISGGETQVLPEDLRNLMIEEERGNKQYKVGREGPQKKVDVDEQRRHIDDTIDAALESQGEKPESLPSDRRERMIQIMQHEGVSDPLEAWEQAMLEAERHGAETGGIEAESQSKNIPGWDVEFPNEPGAAPAAGAEAKAPGEQAAGAEVGGGARGTGGGDREQALKADDLAHLSDEDIRNFFQGRTLYQGAKGSIRFTEGNRPIITMLQDADASTIIHELGHGWLEELARDSQHPVAPESIRQDMQAVAKWLGIDSVDALSETTKSGAPTAKARKAHERFATGFEQYMREGKAPSPELANVFARFKAWLLDLYKTITGLGKEISPEIRAVFDRMLTEEPQHTVVGPERPGGPTITDIHEADAKLTEPHEGEQARDRVIAERERYAEEQPQNIKAELEGSVAKQAEQQGAKPTGEGGGGPSGPGEVVGGGAGPEPVTAGGGGGEEPGKIVKGGSPARPESPTIPGAGREPAGGAEGEHPLASGPAPDHLPRGERKDVDLAGNIRVENLTSIESVAQAIHDSAERNDDFQHVRGGPVTKNMLWDLSSEMGINPATMDDKALEAHLERLLGGMRDMAPKVLAARRLEKQSATMVSDLMKRAALSDSDEDAIELAKAIQRHDLITTALSGGTASWGRTGSAFHDISEGWTGTDLNAMLKANTGRTLFQIKQLARLGAELDKTGSISMLVRDSGRKSFGRMIVEYWINGLISGPQTHITYTVGNTLLALEKMGPETALAAGIGAIRRAAGREGETVRLGEMAAGVRGIKEGFWPAVQSAFEATRTGVTTLLPGEDINKRLMPAFSQGSELVKPAVLNEAATFHDAMGTAYGIMRGLRDAIVAGAALQRAGGRPGAPLYGWEYSPLGAIPNFQYRGGTVLPLGDIARAPSRMIAAIHSFFRPLNYSIDINQRAYRAAANENLTGTAFAARAAELRQSPSPEMMEAGHNAATELTLMGAGGKITAQLSGLTNTEFFAAKDTEGKTIPGTGIPLLKFIDPFVHISSNVIKQSIVQRTPFGILSNEIRADLLGRNGPVAADTAAARMIAGTALSLLFGGLAAEGYVSGSEPKNREDAAIWRQVYQAHSVRIGDTWYAMNRLGPMGMLLSTSADLYEVAHQAERGEFTKAAAHLQHAITQNILDESFMRGPSDLVKAIQDPVRYGGGYIRNFLSSFVPYSVAMGQMARASDPYTRQARTVVDAIKSKVPGLSQSLMPRRDIWGEIMPSRESLGPPGMTAIWEQQVNNDPVNMALLNLGLHVAAVEKKIRNVELTPEQYDDWSRLAGRLAKSRMDLIVRSPSFQNMPPALQHDLIIEQLHQSREVARNMMFMKYPSILVDARSAKMEKRLNIGNTQ
jgi:hypothetical protein